MEKQILPLKRKTRSSRAVIDLTWSDEDEDDEKYEEFIGGPRPIAKSKPKRKSRGWGKQEEEEEDNDDDDYINDDDDNNDDHAVLTLHEYQEVGVRRMLQGLLENTYTSKIVSVNERGQYQDPVFEPKCAHAFLLYDEMGLGKTIQTLEALRRMHTDLGVLDGPVLAVVPSSCIQVWENEVQRFFGDTFTVRRFLESSIHPRTLCDMGPGTIILTTYNIVCNGYKLMMLEELRDMDEAALLKFCNLHKRATHSLNGLVEPERRVQLLAIVEAELSRKKNSKAARIKSLDKKRAYRQLIATPWSCLVLDEIQKIKSVTSQSTRGIGWLTAQYRIGLSGTPIMNSGQEMLTLLKYGLGILDADWHMIGRSPDGPVCRRLMDAVTFGRLKRDIPELETLLAPRDRTQELVRLPWLGDEVAVHMYRKVKDASLNAIANLDLLERGDNESMQEYMARRASASTCVWTQVQRLRQICLHRDLPQYMIDPKFSPCTELPPWTYYNQANFPMWFQERAFTLFLVMRRIFPAAGRDVRRQMCRWLAVAEQHVIQPSPKMWEFMNIYRETRARNPEGKVVVVCHFRSFFDRIFCPWLDSCGLQWTLFGGDTRRKKERALHEFHENPEITVMCLVKTAGSLGLNLQGASSTCIIMDPHYNEALDEQAAQRVDRIGQTEAVVIRRLYMKGSIDEAFRFIQRLKHKNVNAWLGRSDDKRKLAHVRLFLQEYDTVGKAPRNPEQERHLMRRMAPSEQAEHRAMNAEFNERPSKMRRKR